jgi:pantoate--beta-alanine ligase
MEIIHQVAALRARLSQQENIAFVPTMGNLHAGHLALVRQARALGQCVVVSIFVNPLQFGPNEDFDRYPRTLAADCALLADLADIVFAPDVAEMYPEAQTIFVEPPPLANEFCGAIRPGHFRGMATVVLKLLNLVQPQLALFGKKDYQQLAIIRQMVAQFNLPIQIIGGETIRASDGLALSSRNQYLTDSQRTEAAFLFRLLTEISQALKGGDKHFAACEQRALVALEKRGWHVDYVAIRAQAGLSIASVNETNLVVLVAARLGATRLIDNLEIGL